MDVRQWWQDNKLGVIITIIVVIVLASFFIWWLITQQQPRDVVLTNQNNTAVTNSNSPETPVKAPEGGEAVVAARNFAERFGSYSNQNPYDNIKQLFPLMTGRLSSTFTTANTKPGDSYQGVESRLIAIKVVQANAAVAQLVVTLQRSERNASLQPKVYYQDLALTLIKQANQWLVDAAEWSKP
ncbi:MAG: hypothetical protein V1846_01575 [Candidatus Komeilibacteria bacterium]